LLEMIKVLDVEPKPRRKTKWYEYEKLKSQMGTGLLYYRLTSLTL